MSKRRNSRSSKYRLFRKLTPAVLEYLSSSSDEYDDKFVGDQGLEPKCVEGVEDYDFKKVNDHRPLNGMESDIPVLGDEEVGDTEDENGRSPIPNSPGGSVVEAMDDEHEVYVDERFDNSLEDLELESEPDPETEPVSESDQESDDDVPVDGLDPPLPQEHDDRPLFHNATISVKDTILAILTLGFRFTLTGECLSAVLNLILLICPSPNLCPKSLYRLKKLFSNIKAPMIFHYYCSKCMGLLENKGSVCNSCPLNVFSLGYFIEMSVDHQLKTLFKRPSFYGDLQYRFHRNKKNVHGIEDIYDGAEYKRFFDNNGFLSNPNNISFMWYTDGVPLFKSSKFGIWPLFYSINELPYRKRMKTENMIVGGLWFGPSKPDGNTFLQPLYAGLQRLYNGIHATVPHSTDPIVIRSRVICGTCDLPAKSLILNSTQFNGAHGCPRCLLKGERFAIGERGGVHVYPYEENLELRTHQGTVDHGTEALHSGTPVFGVKGPCMLARIVPNVIRSTSVDVMHCLYLGVVKRLLQLWFDPSFSRLPFSMSLLVGVVDRLLILIKPPNFVPRCPRSISEHLSYWKASELKAWFFYYSIPVLRSVMTNEYLTHHMKLVSAICISNQESITLPDVESSSVLLKMYVKEFEILYGMRFMSANLHQLLHLPDTVRDLGPLWVTSCFPFEDMNGKVTRLVHGSRHAELQICSSISYIQNLPQLISNINVNSPVVAFCSKLSSLKPIKLNEECAYGIHTVGLHKYLRPVPLLVAEALYNRGVMGGNCQMFYRLQKGSILYCSKAYTNIKRTVSYCVTYGEQEDVGIIENFIRWSNCNCRSMCRCEAQYYAVLTLFETNDVAVDCNNMPVQNLNLSFLKKMYLKHEVLAVPIQELISLCFCIDVNEEMYCAKPVNTIEAE